MIVGDYGSGRLEMVVGGQGFVNTLTMAQHAGSSAELVIDGDGSDNVHTTLLKVLNFTPGLMSARAGPAPPLRFSTAGSLTPFASPWAGMETWALAP